MLPELLGPNRAKSRGSSERSLFVWRGAIKTVDSKGRADEINEH